MKKALLICGFSLFTFSISAQFRLNKIDGGIILKSQNSFLKNKKKPVLKNLNCQDTLRYAEAKEQTLSLNPTYYYQELWRADNEEISMAFLSSFSNSIHGVEILARKNSNSQPNSVVVQALIYSASQSFEPNTLIGSATVSITDSVDFNYYNINFPVPLNVSGNYCVVIKPITTDGIIDLYVNDVNVSSHDELFCRFKSDYYPSSSGQWIAIPSFSEYTVQPANFEPLVAPIVSYNLGTQIIAPEQIICRNELLALNSEITPNGIYGNRFYNWHSFWSHFNTGIIDSTLNWQTPNNFIANNSYGTQANVQYNSVAQHSVSLFNHFGFYSNCLDLDTIIITINEPNTSAGNDIIICEGESVTLNATGANSYVWNNNAINGSSFIPSNSGTYIVEGTSVNGCTKNDTLLLTVNPLPTVTLATFSSICDTAGLVNLTGGSPAGGTYSGTSVSNNAFNTTIGIGSYPISYSYTNSNGCSSNATQNLLVISCAGSDIIELIENGIILYPNPTSDTFTVETSEESAEKTFIIQDVSGRVLSTGKLAGNKTTISVSSLSTGSYYFSLPETNQTLKFIKQ